MECKWLPALMLYKNYDSWEQYQDKMYQIFRRDFIETYPEFDGKQVNYRRHPIEYGREEAFYHVTCQDYLKDGERVPDFRRCERIEWVRKFIEHYDCNFDKCPECGGVKVWEEVYKGNMRVHVLLEEERYMVVVECRKNYCLLITAFYFEQDHRLAKKIKRYNEYKAKNASQK